MKQDPREVFPGDAKDRENIELRAKVDGYKAVKRRYQLLAGEYLARAEKAEAELAKVKKERNFYLNRHDRVAVERDEAMAHAIVLGSKRDDALDQNARLREALKKCIPYLPYDQVRTPHLCHVRRDVDLALSTPAPKSSRDAKCDCHEQTERYSCPSDFGKAHCPKHCKLCNPHTHQEKSK